MFSCFDASGTVILRCGVYWVAGLQEVVIMSNACDKCGYRSSDIKAGGEVSEKGCHLTLDVSEQDDLRRDVIKAESASISIPEADLEVTTGG